jgi:hypothetical protein
MYTSVREAIFAEATPLFINYHLTSKVLCVPNDGPVTSASRAELVEATANLILKDGYEKEIVLSKGLKAITLPVLGASINEVAGKHIVLGTLPPTDNANASAEDDDGAKSEWWFEKRVS